MGAFACRSLLGQTTQALQPELSLWWKSRNSPREKPPESIRKVKSSRRTSAATRRSRWVFPLPRGPMTMVWVLELPLHSRTDSTMDANSSRPYAEGLNDLVASERKPGLYFLVATVIVSPSLISFSRQSG